jgi:DNA-binding transcriptional ArsR family regulator
MTELIASILKQHQLPHHSKSHAFWWGYVWRGLVVSKNAQHYKAMGKALWLYLYFIIHADRKKGTLFRITRTIAEDTGIPARTIQLWLKTLRENGYIQTERTGRSLQIKITKWRPIVKR